MPTTSRALTHEIHKGKPPKSNSTKGKPATNSICMTTMKLPKRRKRRGGGGELESTLKREKQREEPLSKE
jgi:hypothetical protein